MEVREVGNYVIEMFIIIPRKRSDSFNLWVQKHVFLVCVILNLNLEVAFSFLANADGSQVVKLLMFTTDIWKL